MEFLSVFMGPIMSKAIEILSMYMLRPSDAKKRFNAVIVCFMLDPLYEMLNHVNKLDKDSERVGCLKHMIIKWVERRKEYLYLVPRVTTLIASSPLKPSYIKERDLELIPQIVSLPAPVLEKLMYDTSDIFNSILSALKGDNVSRAIELVEEEIRKRYEDSDIHLSPPVCRLIASECIKLVYVAEKLGLDLSSPNDMRELMNLYSMFVYIINRVNFTIAVAEVPQMIIDIISSFAKLTPSQGEGGQQSIDAEDLKGS